jgi:hypothetical protein
MLCISVVFISTFNSQFCRMQVRALGAPCDAYASGFSTTHVSGAVIEAATDAEMEAIMTDIGIPAALRVQFRLIFAEWKGAQKQHQQHTQAQPYQFLAPFPAPDFSSWGAEASAYATQPAPYGMYGQSYQGLLGFGLPSPDQLSQPHQAQPPVPAKKEKNPMKRKCGECFGQGHVVCFVCEGKGFTITSTNQCFTVPPTKQCYHCHNKRRLLCNACDATGFQK